MSEATLDRLSTLEEAKALEAAGAQWEAHHVAAVLGIARKTVYDTAWLRRIGLPAGSGSWRWDPKTVREQQVVESKRMRRGVRVKG